jgi:hypothetical protein
LYLQLSLDLLLDFGLNQVIEPGMYLAFKQVNFLARFLDQTNKERF